MADRTLEFTPSWAVATAVTFFVVISLLIVKLIEKVEERLKEGKKKSLLLAVDKMKEELMLLGFISFVLVVCLDYIVRICLPYDTLNSFTPCYVRDMPDDQKKASADNSRRLLLDMANSLLDKADEYSPRRVLAAKAKACPTGKAPFVSYDGMHQLHIFIFVLALCHVAYSLIAMGLATLKVRSWKVWEDEAQSNNHDDFAEMTKTLTLKRQSTFVQYHASKPWSGNRIMIWVVCFFRQFGISVTRADYLSLRLGFIKNHNTGNKFNFHSYMVRCMEDEFQQIVGISAWLWAFVVAFLLFNIAGTNLFFWMAFIPVVIVLIVGAKLQHVIATLALEHAMNRGALASIRPRDDLFWFKTPTLLLKLIHFVLFANAFELATFIWFWWQFGLNSCLLDHKAFVYIRIGLGVLTQILCSYSTLPLYALVTQMGSHYKQSIFQNDVKEKLQNWRKGAKKRAKMGALSEEGSYTGDDSVMDGSVDGPEDGSTNPHGVHLDPRSGADIAREEQMMRDFKPPTEAVPAVHHRAASESFGNKPSSQDVEMTSRSFNTRSKTGNTVQFQAFV